LVSSKRYVGQEPVLFRGSIAENIAKGRASFGDKIALNLEEAIAEMKKIDRARTKESQFKEAFDVKEDQASPLLAAHKVVRHAIIVNRPYQSHCNRISSEDQVVQPMKMLLEQQRRATPTTSS
jgi:hypothetical protein